MTNEELLEKTKELLAIESTADNLAALRSAHKLMVDFVRQHEHGSDITIEEFESNGRPSFLAYKGATRPGQFHLIFNGHTDVVPGKPEQFTPSVRDGKLYGRGTHDMKAACIVMADAFCESVHRVPFALGLQIVTDEENAGKDGTLYQIQQGVRSDFVICGECGRAPGTYEIANRAKGIFVVEVGFPGKSAHGAYPWKGDNAAMRAASFIHKLHELYPVPHEPTADSTITVTSMSAVGTAHTTTPDYATIKLNGRFAAGDAALNNIESVTALVSQLDPQAEIIATHDMSSAFHTDPDNPQLRKLKAAAEQVENHEFELVQRHGSSDGRFYGDVGNQACEFGIAGEHQHGDDENISFQAFDDYRQTLRAFLASDV